jgi:hypothetical protein
MSDNIKVPASKIPKGKKILLYPGDPLIGVLNPDSYIIVNKGSLEPAQSVNVDNGGEGNQGDGGDGGEDPETPDPKSAPKLEDITLISKTLITDGNGNQFAEFKFNIKNSVGSEVVGVYGYAK